MTQRRDRVEHEPPGMAELLTELQRLRSENAALRQGEARFRALFGSMAEGAALHEVVCDPAGRAVNYRVLEVNPRYEEILGLSRDAVVGRLATEAYRTEIPPYLDELTSVGLGKPAHRFETYFEPLERYFDISVAPLDPGCFATIFTDITARKRMDQALRESERRFRLLLEASPDMVFVLDREERVIYVNSAAARLWRQTPDQVLGRSQGELFPPRIAAQHSLAIRRVWSTRQPERSETALEMGGTALWLETQLVPLADDEGQVSALLGLARDISERRQAEASRAQVEAQQRRQQKLEALGTLAAGVAHEINNPLNAVINYAQLIHNRLPGAHPLLKYAERIVEEGGRVSQIVRNLLAFARQDLQSHSPARLQDIIEATLCLVRSLLRREQIAIEVDVPDELPALKCRSQEIQHVLLNLLTNARDALAERFPDPHADKRIRIEARRVEIEGHPWLRTSVRDSGPGIPPEIGERVFDPFFTTKPRDQGTGLGLSISYGIVQEHHGRLWFETVEGQGTCFHLDLPEDNGWAVAPPASEVR